MFSQIVKIFWYFIKSLGDFRSGGMKYLFYTGLIALGLLVLMAVGIWKFSAFAGTWLATVIPWDWAQQSVVFSFVIGFAVVFLCWVLVKYIMLILLGPMLSIVSERIETKLKGHAEGQGFSLAGSAMRSVRVNSRNVLREVVMSILLLILSFIPGINFIALILLFLVQAYFAGFGVMDFYLERHYTFKETVAKVYQHKWAAICIGSIFTLLMFIPVLGVAVAPYFTTVAATRYFAEMEPNLSKPVV
jgi:CysZ protein